MATQDFLPPMAASLHQHRHDSFSSSTSDGSGAPVPSLGSSSTSEARSSSIPFAADPPVGSPLTRLGSRLSSFRSSANSEKRQSLISVQLEKKSFGDKLKFALDLSFAGGDPARQARAYQEPVVVRSGRARAVQISRSRPGTSTSVTSDPTNSSYSSKPFASRGTAPFTPTAVELAAEPTVLATELDSLELPAAPKPEVETPQVYVETQSAPPPRPSSWQLANLNTRLEQLSGRLDQQLELPPVREEDEYETDEMGFVRNLATRLQRIHTPPNNYSPRERPQISLPIELLSASNNIVFEAPDLSQITPPSHDRHISTLSDDTDPGLTDSSSISSDSTPNSSSDASPTSANFGATPTSYYDPVRSPLIHPTPISPIKADLAGPITIVSDDQITTLPPAIPQRAISHSKREHVRLARARSMRARSRSASRAPSDIISHQPSLSNLAEAAEPVSPLEETGHPFGTELAQLDEMAQELARAAAAEHARRSMLEDHTVMASAGLEHYSAGDYQFDLDSLISELTVEENPWSRAPPPPLAI